MKLVKSADQWLNINSVFLFLKSFYLVLKTFNPHFHFFHVSNTNCCTILKTKYPSSTFKSYKYNVSEA